MGCLFVIMQLAYKPGSVAKICFLSFIWVAGRPATLSAYPSTSSGPLSNVDIHGLSTQDPHGRCVTTTAGVLLPHLLTLTVQNTAVIFFCETIPSRISSC